jgi:hypothetical protein
MVPAEVEVPEAVRARRARVAASPAAWERAAALVRCRVRVTSCPLEVEVPVS